MSKERPILFNGAMVRAILAGQKTQTRRALKQATGPSLSVDMVEDAVGVAELSWLHGDGPGYDVNESILRVHCPFGVPGDRLWVRETWAQHPDYPDARRAVYRAAPGSDDDTELWRPSIHMPRWACRLVLEITSVRVERLQDITAQDVASEGVACDPDINPFHDFEELWTSTGGDWASNPWVWVIEFKVVTP